MPLNAELRRKNDGSGALNKRRARIKGYRLLIFLDYTESARRYALTPVYDILRPVVQTCPIVFASPHSGRAYSDAFLRQTVLDKVTLRSSEDAFVDQLIAPACQFGAPVICANVPRAYVDFNRGADEYDPAVIDGAASSAISPRIASGLGVIPRVVAGGRAIYSGKLSLDEAGARITNAWQPYHCALKGLMDETVSQFGEVILLDMHSMPSEAALLHHHSPQIDIVLGDRHGASASGDVTRAIEAAFVAEGLRVSRNAPFAGAYIAQHYGRPVVRRHVVQIEMSRALYLDERTITPSAQYDAFAALLGRVLRQITADFGQSLPMAAE
jgi:N-formylglutamate amidohydrolase